MGRTSYVTTDDDLIGALDAANVTIETADADYPASRLQSIPMAKAARGTDPGSGVNIKIDFGENVRPKFWSLLNTNIASGEPVVYSYNDAFITPSGETLNIPYRAFDMKAYKAASWTAKRYFIVNLNGCTFNHAFAQIGKVIAAPETNKFSFDFSPGIQRGYGHNVIHNFTPYDVEYTHVLRSGINYLKFGWDPHLKAALLDEILALMGVTYGGTYPFIIIPDEDEAEFFYMRNEDRIDWNEAAARSLIEQCFLNLRELSRGKIQTS